MNISELWQCKNEIEWLNALNKYWEFVKPENITIEKELNELDPCLIEKMDENEFYDFLLNKYFKWKYTAPNRYASSIEYLKKYQQENRINELLSIKQQLFSLDKNNIEEGLKIVTKIKGLGPAGGSGLLSLLFPNYYGTIDQFIVKALCDVIYLPNINDLLRMNPENLKINDGVILIEIMRAKAKELNQLFNSKFWTPRKIDMILWTYGR